MVAKYAYDYEDEDEDEGEGEEGDGSDALFDAVSESLDLEGFPSVLLRLAGIILARLSLSSGDVWLRCDCNEAPGQVSLRIHFCASAEIPLERRAEALEVLRLLNLRVPLGHFTLDLQSSIALCTTMEVGTTLIGPDLFRPAIRRLVLTADIYQPLILSMLDDERIGLSRLEAAGLLDHMGIYPIDYVVARAIEQLEV